MAGYHVLCCFWDDARASNANGSAIIAESMASQVKLSLDVRMPIEHRRSKLRTSDND
jgi:hypothetical protein